MSKQKSELACPVCGEDQWIVELGLMCLTCLGAPIRHHALLGMFRCKHPERIIAGVLPVKCTECKGSGKLTCPECEGTGWMTCPTCEADVECDVCDGDGTVKCEECRGLGLVLPEVERVDTCR